MFFNLSIDNKRKIYSMVNIITEINSTFKKNDLCERYIVLSVSKPKQIMLKIIKIIKKESTNLFSKNFFISFFIITNIPFIINNPYLLIIYL